MNDKKKLVIVIAALAAVLVVSVAIYDAYKDRVDPATGAVVSGDSQAMGAHVAQSDDSDFSAFH